MCGYLLKLKNLRAGFGSDVEHTRSSNHSRSSAASWITAQTKTERWSKVDTKASICWTETATCHCSQTAHCPNGSGVRSTSAVSQQLCGDGVPPMNYVASFLLFPVIQSPTIPVRQSFVKWPPTPGSTTKLATECLDAGGSVPAFRGAVWDRFVAEAISGQAGVG